jgi:hypothetical protein
LSEEHELGVFENRRSIFKPKEEEMAGGWRILHNELRNLYASPNIIRVINSRMIMGGSCSTHGTVDKCIKHFVLRPRREETTRRTEA